jgi:hypothetical protein
MLSGPYLCIGWWHIQLCICLPNCTTYAALQKWCIILCNHSMFLWNGITHSNTLDTIHQISEQKSLYALIPSQSIVFIHVVFRYDHWQVCVKGHGMSTACISAFYARHQLCNCLVQFYVLTQCFRLQHGTPVHFCHGKVLFSCMNAHPFHGHQHDVLTWCVNTCHMMSNIYIPFPVLPQFCSPPPPQQNICCDLQRDPHMCVCVRERERDPTYLIPFNQAVEKFEHPAFVFLIMYYLKLLGFISSIVCQI